MFVAGWRHHALRCEWPFIIIISSSSIPVVIPIPVFFPKLPAGYNHTDPQYTWLLNDLKSVDRAVTPWVVVIKHSAWYNTYTVSHRPPYDVMLSQHSR